jgi:hypothetical protein
MPLEKSVSREIYETLSPEILAQLPAEMRAEMSKQSNSALIEARRSARALERVQRIPMKRRDMTPTAVLVHAKNTPIGAVFTVIEEEVTVEDGIELVKVEDGVDKKGEAKFKVVEVKKYRQEFQNVTRLIERPLQYKERVSMPRWVVDLMEGNDHVVVLNP